MLLAGVLLAVREIPTFAQIYAFEKLPVPSADSVQTIHAFYVYAHQDAPDTSLGSPFVKFHAMFVHSLANKTAAVPEPSVVHLAMYPFDKPWLHTKPLVRCSGGKLISNFSNIFTLNLMEVGETAKDKQFPVRETGVYVLAIANCGTLGQATVDGSVVVKNAYGFLPGNEYHKMLVYALSCLLYGILALVWMGFSLRRWKNLVSIQHCLAIMVFLGLIESFLWLLFFTGWNNSGTRQPVLFGMATVSSAAKSIFSYMVILAASLGWGVTRPYLDYRAIRKMKVMSAVYIVLDLCRAWALFVNYSDSYALVYVMLCLLPETLLGMAIFYWILSALSNMIEQLRKRRQVDKLLLFERLRACLVLAICVASSALTFHGIMGPDLPGLDLPHLPEFPALSFSTTTRWKYKWFVADGIPTIISVTMLSVLMFLWLPADDARRDIFQVQADDEDSDEDSDIDVKAKSEKKAGKMWAADGGDDDEEEESFWSQCTASDNDRV